MACRKSIERPSVEICKSKNSCYDVVGARSAQKQYKQERKLSSESEANFCRPIKACTAGCRYYQGGGWDPDGSLSARCKLTRGRVIAPEVGKCEGYMAGTGYEKAA